MTTKEEFMETVDEIIEISKNDRHIKKQIVEILRDIIESMAEKMSNE